jgi:hypothetical protein
LLARGLGPGDDATMVDQPTIAAVLLPNLDAEGALALLGSAMGAKGYSRRDAPPPPGYPRAEGEWVGVCLVGGPKLAVLVPDDVGLVFRWAMWLSAAAEGRWLGALRRYRGMAPTLKLYSGGLPRWRDGADDDLEVDWDVPTSRPVDVPEPARLGLPGKAVAAARELQTVAAPYRELASVDGVRVTGWLAQSSPLTRR